MPTIFHRISSIGLILAAFLASWSGCLNTDTSDHRGMLPDVVDFNYHIKPILSDRCYACHGPDKNAIKGDLQLNTKEGLLGQKLTSGRRAFVAGKPRKSEAFQRMISQDPELQMPPPEFPLHLSEYELELFRKWIEQGAEYKNHWAFLPIEEVSVPPVINSSWTNNAIDSFILQKIEANKFTPKDEASKEVLLRRVSLDLTGLPPTIKEIDAFLQAGKDGYDILVDRLLNSPHYGEKMALTWLDIARYADSNGYSQDGLRIMWPWRDWVIKAFNENLPYDQFITWQIAGDKLPDATEEQKLATGFLRNYRQNGEGGIVDEEYRIEYTADRSETTATTFLGMTMQCARCHDHKYDPISQEEYYEFFSFFNSVPEAGSTANDGNSGPELVLTPGDVKLKIQAIDKMIAEHQSRQAQQVVDVPDKISAQSILEGLSKHLLTDVSFNDLPPFKNQAPSTTDSQLSGTVEQVTGVKGQGIRVTGFESLSINEKNLSFARSDPFSFAFYLKVRDHEEDMSILNHVGRKAANYPGYEILLENGYPTFRMAHSLPAILLQVRTPEPMPIDQWKHLTFTYDGSGKAEGVSIYMDGEKVKADVIFDKLSQGITNRRKNLIVGGRSPYQYETKAEILIDELLIFNKELSPIEALLIHDPNIELESKDLKSELLAHYSRIAPPNHKLTEVIHQLRQEKFGIEDTLISVMVMEDLPSPRPTYILNRGSYEAPGKEVFPNTPGTLFSFGQKRPDRLGLAEWLIDPQNPLTARVAVNRLWQQFFGIGLVKTTEDFGNQGSLPSHPELLDWLASRFVESGWDVKAMIKLIVTSATYRQASACTVEERNADPENTLLARGPSYRLAAELIRDCALEASGLLVRQIGGPSVRPYQPEGLWSEKGEFSQLKNYNQDTGPKLYRRGLYTFWRRTSPLPAMTAFDAPTRDICVVSRQQTNTPLQALVLLNDPQFVEAARVLAQKVIASEPDPSTQIILAHRSLTGLKPTPKVLSLLVNLESRERQRFYENKVNAKDLLSVGEYPLIAGQNLTYVAAMTIVCSTIMSFDETIMKR